MMMSGDSETRGRLNSPVIYLAGAGTGKTHQLVEDFYAALVECDFDPTRLLALTFTENAASEMRERIRRKLLMERGSVALPLAQELVIGTIHSFCRAELSRHALLAALSPQFTVLDESESQALMRRTLLAILINRFNSESRRAESTLVREAGFNSYFRSSEYGVSLEDEILRLYRQLRAQGVTDFEELVLDVADCHWRDAREEIVRAAHNVLAVSPEEMGGKSAGKLAGFQAMLRQHLPELESLRADRSGFYRLSELASSINLRGSEAYRSLLAPLKNEIVPLCQRQILQRCMPAVRDELLGILVALDHDLEEEKAARNVLDFEDLQLRFLRLLQEHPEVARSYRKRLARVFVDEFQDTNLLQVTLIDMLAGPDAQYLVGDPKQAIYAFRHADPRGIVRKREAFSSQGGIVRELQANYRSRPEILRFVNEFFRRLEGNEGGVPMGFSYEEVHAATSFASKEDPSVELVCLPAGKNCELGAEERRQAEARWVAGYLREVVERGLIRRTREGESGTLGYGDFAVLMRRNRSIPVFEEALASAGVPFVSEASSGFLQTPEIAAMSDLLQLLLTPKVDVLTAQVLRSDIVGISSTALFELGCARVSNDDEREPLFAVLKRCESVLSQETDIQAAREFRSWFSRLRDRLPFLSAAEVVQEVISASRLREKLVAHGASQRALLNLSKFLDLSMRIQGYGATALFALTSRVRELNYQSASLGEMWVEAGDYVRIMSVHKAKGLTIGAVILAGVNFQLPAGHPAFVVDPDPSGGGFRLGMKHRLAQHRGVSERFYAEGIERVESSVDAEELRLLYVALTRAVEHLVVVGVPTPDSGKLSANPWGRRLGGLLHLDDDGILAAIPPFGELVRIRQLEPEQIEQEASSLSAYPSLAELIAEQQPQVSSADQALAQQLTSEADLEPNLDRLNRYIFSVSEFLAWAAGAAETALNPSPGGAGDEILQSQREAEYVPADESSEAARRLGILVHELLAAVCAHLRDTSPAEIVSVALAEDFLARWLPGQMDAVASEHERLAPMLAAFARSDLLAELKLARAVRPEFGFLLRHGSSFFRGRIDLLVVEDSEVRLVDFKSDRLAAGVTPEQCSARYRDQLLFYTRAVRSLYPALAVKPSLFFLDGGSSWVFDFADEEFAILDSRLDEFIRFSCDRLREVFVASTK